MYYVNMVCKPLVKVCTCLGLPFVLFGGFNQPSFSFGLSQTVYIPAAITTNDSACDLSYPTVCIPSPPPDLNCEDVLPYEDFQVLSPDPHGLDRDKDGLGCESE